MPKYESSSGSDDEPTGHGKRGRLFGRQRPMHDVLGGGKGITLLSTFTQMHVTFTSLVYI